MAKKEWQSFRELARINFGQEIEFHDDGRPIAPEGSLRKGSLLRIADALERLATGKTELETQKELVAAQAQRAIFKRDYEERQVVVHHLYRRIRALRGVITKLKNKGRT